MANVTASVTQPVISVTTTDNPVTVSQDGNIISSVTSSTLSVAVSSTETEVNVSPLSAVGQSTIREALSVVDTGGDGSLTYSNVTGVFTYTGPSAAEVRSHFTGVFTGGDGDFDYNASTGVFTVTGPNQDEANGRISQAPVQVRSHLSNTAPVLYNAGTGVISLDTDAVFSNTLANAWFTTQTTDNLTEGSTNLYFTEARARDSISADGNQISYSNVTGQIDLVGKNITAGSGLQGGGTTLNDTTLTVGQGFGIQVDADKVRLANLELANFFTGGDGIDVTATSNGAQYNGGTIDVDSTVIRTNVASQGINGNFSINGDLAFDDFSASLRGTASNPPTTGHPGAGVIFFEGTDNYFYLKDAGATNPYFLSEVTNRFNAAVEVNQANLDVNTGNINITSGGLYIDGDQPITQTTNLVRHSQNKLNYLFMGHNGIVSSNPLNGASANAAVLTVDPARTTLGFPKVNVGVSPGGVWDTASGVNNISSVGELVDTYNDQTIGGAKVFSQDLTIQGNVDVQGNLNYVEVEDLLVRQNTITMNYGNTSVNTTSAIIVDRTGYPGGVSNAAIIWQENLDKWQLNNGSSVADIITSDNIGSFSVTSVNGETGVVVLDTGDLQENGNLFFTDARANSAIDARVISITANVDSVNGATGVVVLDTDDIAQGSANLYYTSANAQADANIAIGNNTTDNLSEGSTNQYFTTDRANTAIGAYTGNMDNVANLTAADRINANRIFIEDSAFDPIFTATGPNAFIQVQDDAQTYTFGRNSGIQVQQSGDNASNVLNVPRILFTKHGSNADYANGVFPGIGINTWTSATESSANRAREWRISFPYNGYDSVYSAANVVTGTTSIISALANSETQVQGTGWGPNLGYGPYLYSTANVSPGQMIFRTSQVAVAQDLALTDEFFYANLMTQANSTVMYLEDKVNFGREDDGTSYSFPKTAGTNGQVLQLDANSDLQFVTIAGTGTVTSVDSGAGLTGGPITTSGTLAVGAGYGITVNADDVAFSNSVLSTLTDPITTTGNITGGYITAGNDTGGNGIFIGDINGAVQLEGKNDTGDTLAKGKAVYLTGTATGSEPHIALANAENAAHMPVIGIVKNQIPNTETGEIVVSGKVNIGAHSFTQGADLFVNGAGDLTETIPAGEGNLIQKIGKVVNSTTIIVQGAFRTNATPNLDEGNIFLGDTSNYAVSETMNTAFYSHVVLGSNNVLLGDGSSVPTETGAEALIENNIYNASVRLQQFRETVETTANVSGAVTFNVANGSIFEANVVGDITSLDLTGAQAGTSATLILTQGATTGTLTAGSSWRWAGGEKTLSTNTGDVDVISVVNDGSLYYASLTKGYVN